MQLGETQKKFINELSDAMKPADEAKQEEDKKAGDLKSCIQDGEWRLNLEQIVATILADSLLSEFFDKRYSLLDTTKKHRNRSTNSL